MITITKLIKQNRITDDKIINTPPPPHWCRRPLSLSLRQLFIVSFFKNRKNKNNNEKNRNVLKTTMGQENKTFPPPFPVTLPILKWKSPQMRFLLFFRTSTKTNKQTVVVLFDQRIYMINSHTKQRKFIITLHSPHLQWSW